jgi:nicotinamidase-related amidase
VFASTGLARTLRHLGIETLVIGGVATNVCVEVTVRHAVDLGYQVILVDDACAAYSTERHEAALLNFQGFGWVRVADEVLALLEHTLGLRARSE